MLQKGYYYLHQEGRKFDSARGHMVEKKLKKGYTPLFDMDDKALISFAYRARNSLVMDTVAPEMMRRLKVSIDKFNKNSTKQTEEMLKLTNKIIILTMVLTFLAVVQIILLLQ